MRMSMARKIIAIVVVLVVVAILILMAGLYSVTSLTGTMDSIMRQANRINDMNQIFKIVLQR